MMRCCNPRVPFDSAAVTSPVAAACSRLLHPSAIGSCSLWCSNYWLQWIFLAASWAFFILIDMLFLTEDTFIYDPSYKTWSVRAGYEEK